MEALKTLGIAGFLFFFIKGLLWLLLFVLVTKGVVSKERLEGIKERLRSPFKSR
jgi:energy-converting hydrogenase Eha subunit G